MSSFSGEHYNPVFCEFGLRARLVRLFVREFVANVFVWCERNPEEADPDIAEQVTRELAELQPLKEPKYVAEPVKFISERDREERIRAGQMAEDDRDKVQHDMALWRARQLGEVGNI